MDSPFAIRHLPIQNQKFHEQRVLHELQLKSEVDPMQFQFPTLI